MQGLRKEVVAVARAKGFDDYTPIQKKASPRILAGENLLVTAPTGFGKTEAAMLPVLSRMLDFKDKGQLAGICTLYITPLKSLNRDMLERLTFWGKVLGFGVAVRHGDTKPSERQKQRDAPPHLLVTTPETLQSLLVAPKLKDALANVRFVIVDEVHELADSERGVQLAAGLARLRLKAPGFQIIGLSATVRNKEAVARFLAPDCGVAEQELGRLLDIRVELPDGGRPEFKELGLRDESKAALGLVVDSIESSKRTLVFVNTRFTAESLGHLLSQTRVANQIAVHHSSLAKEARLEAEEEFKREASSLKAIVCTSSLELGIDIGAVDLVVQFNSPRQVSRLVQRIGRSGHRKNLVPKGVIIAGGELDCLEALVLREKALAGEIEETRIRSNALDVAGHQLAGLALDYGSITLADALGILRTAKPFETLSPAALEAVARQMAQAKCFAFDGERVTASKRTLLYYYENLGTIRDSKKRWIRDAVTRKNVGLLDEAFVSEYLQEGVTFITRGKAWRVISAEEEIQVEPSSDLTAAIPEWVGEEIPVTAEVATAVEDAFARLPECDAKLGKKLAAYAKEQAGFFTPSREKCFVEGGDRWTVVHSFWGSKANEALARALAFHFALTRRESVRTKAGAYGVLLEFDKHKPAADVCAALDVLKKGRDARTLLETRLPDTRIYRRKLIGVAKAMGLVSKTADLQEFGLARLARAFKGTPAESEALAEVWFDELDADGMEAALRRTRFETVPFRESASPLAAEFFDYGSFSELIVPGAPSEKLVQAFRDNLLEKREGLYCQYCGKTHTLSLGEAPEELRCPYCKSSQLTRKRYKAVLEKRKARRKLTEEETKELNDAYRSANLLSVNGRRALHALNTFGVGPETAARLLGRAPSDDAGFYGALLEAQKNFIKTRRFWRV